MGTLAMFFNGVAMVGIIRSLKNGFEPSSLLLLYNKAFLSLIIMGDFLLGIYLLSLSIYDSIIFGRSFCKHQAEWLTGSTCSTLGVISTVGSQLSLFSMTALTMVWCTALAYPSIRTPKSIDKGTFFQILTSAIITLVASFLIAVIPLAPSLKDYFVKELYYDPAYKLFTGLSNKDHHIRVLQAYHNSTDITFKLTWDEISSLVDGMFSKRYGNLARSAVHFYGNDFNCRFKYFVQKDHPRRSGNSALTTANNNGSSMELLILIINFVCILVITLSLIFAHGKNKDCPVGDQQNSTLQRKMFIVIASDILLWIPLLLISLLHNLSVIDATHWYAPFVMTILPVNSIVNPLLHDETLAKCLFKYCQRVQSNKNDLTMDASSRKDKN
jgi:hypothetical protein